MRLVRLAAMAVAMLTGATTAHAQASVESFYKDNRINLIVGYGPGGAYDVYARQIAQFLGKHIPGNPTVIVQNMDGAGSMRAANHLYVTAPKDGTVIGTFGREIPLLAIQGGNPGVQYDPTKYTWLGSPTQLADDAYILWVRDGANVRNVADAQKPGTPFTVASSGGSDYVVPLVMKDFLGINLRIIRGYPDGLSGRMAMERTEVDANFVALAGIYTSRPDWLKPNSGFTPLVQGARRTRHPALPNVPTLFELAKDERARQMVDLVEAPFLLGRPYVAPPGIPADRAKALQAGFMAVMKDPEYLAAAQKLKIDISPVTAEESLAMIERWKSFSPEAFDYMRKAQGG